MVVGNVPPSFSYVHVYIGRIMAVVVCDAFDAPVAVACQCTIAVVLHAKYDMIDACCTL